MTINRDLTKYILQYIYTLEYYAAIKNNEETIYPLTWKYLQDTSLSEK